MHVIEYQVKVPVVSFGDYSALLREVLSSENPAVVSVLESGASDVARLPNTRSTPTSVFRTVKSYTVPSEPACKVKTCFKHPHYNTTVTVGGALFTLYVVCDTQEEKPNRFLLPSALLQQRVQVELDITDPAVWNTTHPVAEACLGAQPYSLPPPVLPTLFVYALVVAESLDPLIENVLPAYLILLHRRMVERLQSV
jgi:hypothetical protein